MTFLCLCENVDTSYYLHMSKETEFLESAYRSLVKKYEVFPLCIFMLRLAAEIACELDFGDDC